MAVSFLPEPRRVIMSSPHRHRLPNRRPSYTETLEVAGQVVTATIGFDPADDQPRELFLTAGKEGSTLSALLSDAAVVISVALQHGIPAQSLAKSIGRLPEGPVTPADLDQGKPARLPASPIGAALDLLRSFEDAPESR
jgi:ribonucleoside-diphosphate reductase alpha chain